MTNKAMEIDLSEKDPKKWQEIHTRLDKDGEEPEIQNGVYVGPRLPAEGVE